MAAVEVTITGMLYDRANRTAQSVVLIDEATLTGLGVGGGPVLPPGGGGGEPPGIWPSPGHPAHPIAPGGRPPGIWGPTDPRPGWGLPGDGGGGEIPPKPEEPPPDGESKPPPEEGGWGYWAEEVNSWVYKPSPDEAQPKQGKPGGSTPAPASHGRRSR